MSEWLDSVTQINQWSRGGVRAPHKPLLILYAIGRLIQTGSSSMAFREVEQSLGRLIVTYGPPGARPTPQYPFRRLENDGLWQVRMSDGTGDPGERVTDLRRAAIGAFEPGFEEALAEPALRTAVVQALLNDHFPPSLHDDLLSEIGIEAGDLTALTPEAGGRRKRDPGFRTGVLTAYEYQCAFCGFDGRLGDVSVGLDAAHIRWHALGGPDSLDNGLALCTIHHKLFDKGALGLDDHHQVRVSQSFVGRGDSAERLVLALAGRSIVGPQRGLPTPAPEHIDWHAAQVFRAPARVVEGTR